MKKIILFLGLLLAINLASASIVSFNFDKTLDREIERGIYYSSSVIFEVTTPTNQLCRYSLSDTSYNSMNSFEDNFNTIHRIEFGSLSDGIHTYYVRCRDSDDWNDATDGLTRLEATFKTSAPIAAQISLDDSPLTDGKYEINLVTTKIPSTTPKLTYSYDGISYSPIVLNGGGKNWKGYLIVADSPNEKVGSFKFEARDLENKIGTEIFGSKVFITDTRPPEPINTLSALGEFEEIRLEWYLDEDEDIDRINIYKSENPNVDLTDNYKSIDGDTDYYIDNNVDNGQTYYYRIAPEDSAGNIAALSREIKVTALRSESSSQDTSSGLDPEFWGLVDALLVEIDLIEEEINLAESSVKNTGTEEERRIISITSTIQSSKSEINAIKRTVENLKSQDLTKEILESRISSNQVKLSILRKGTPSILSISESLEVTPQANEEEIRRAILEKAPELSSSLIDKSVKESKKLIEEHNLKLKNKIKIFEVTYLDGTKDKISLIEHSIDSITLTAIENNYIFLKLPSGSIDADSIDLENSDYSPESERLISFKTDTKKITYTLDEEISPQIINSINIIPATIIQESTPLTGYFTSNLSTVSSFGTTFLVIIIAGLFVYLFYVKKASPDPKVSEFIDKAKEVKRLHKEGKTEEYNSLYQSLQTDYVGLSDPAKKKIFKEVRHML